MSDKSDSGRRPAGKARARQGGRPPIDALAKGRFIKALSRGASHEAAARAAGFSRGAFYRVRKRDGEFAAMWEEAIQRSQGPRFVSGGAKRRLQLRRNRSVRFTEARQEIFLSHFAGTCNLADAAEEAGVCESTVDNHRRKDPDFARRYQEALEQGYEKLDADLLARRLAAQRRLRAIEPTGEPEPEFDRALKLLQRWDRRNGSVGPRTVAHGRLQSWSFDQAIEALDKRLRALGVRRGLLPPPEPPKEVEEPEEPDGDNPPPDEESRS